MNCYLVRCFAGFMALDEDFTLLDYELFPQDKLVEKWMEGEKQKITPEEELLLSKIGKNCVKINIETNLNPNEYNNLKFASKFGFQSLNKGGEFLRSNLGELLVECGFLDSKEDLLNIKRTLALRITEEKMKKASEAEDLLLIQAIHAIEELEESEVKLVERIREWYALHFPEMDEVRDHTRYVDLISQYGQRDTVIKSGLVDSNINLGESMGAKLSSSDLEVIQGFASTIKSIQESKKSTALYVDEKMAEIAPNLRDLVGASLGAKIIAHTGGIRRLAMLPSSTVQILGAEKALFRHLKTGERPPKHGLIYQHPEVRGSRYWIRGKVARALASKISLAVRKDVFSGEFDPKISESFQERLEEIKKENPFPKRTSKSKKKKKRVKRKRKKDKFRFKKGKEYF